MVVLKLGKAKMAASRGWQLRDFEFKWSVLYLDLEKSHLLPVELFYVIWTWTNFRIATHKESCVPNTLILYWIYVLCSQPWQPVL